MKLSIPTSWDNRLLEGLHEINKKNHNIFEIYGALPFGITPGGRPPFDLPQIKKEAVEEHVDIARSCGFKFNYLLNANTLGNMEYTKKGREKLFDCLSWINNLGAESITVSTPYLVELIKKEFTSLRIVLSIQANIYSIREAEFYENSGVERITVHERLNRDFKFLQNLRDSLKVDLCLIANLACLFQCPMAVYHKTLPEHVCKDREEGYTMFIDWPKITCSLMKATKPSDLIESRWIRPEDTNVYESMGYEYFKLVDRRWPTEKILNVTKVYSNRKYDGNLFDLLPIFPPSRVFCSQFAEQFPDVYNGLKQLNIDKVKAPELYIDNRKLDGFIEFFKHKDCGVACESCRYCDDVAKHIKIKNKKALEDYRRALIKINDILKLKNMNHYYNSTS